MSRTATRFIPTPSSEQKKRPNETVFGPGTPGYKPVSRYAEFVGQMNRFVKNYTFAESVAELIDVSMGLILGHVTSIIVINDDSR
jgi:hypothetical protein